MLTKEECLKALDWLHTLTLFSDYETPEHRRWFVDVRVAMLVKLINEHFELLEKYQNLQDENARLSFDKIVNNIEDMNYKLWLENPPLTIENLNKTKYVPIWDDFLKEWFIFLFYNEITREVCCINRLGDKKDLWFEENRFYRKQVE